MQSVPSDFTLSVVVPVYNEAGFSYNGCTYAESKHIGWRDGFRALWCIIRYR